MLRQFLILSLLLLLIGAGALSYAYRFLTYTNPQQAEITIPKGASVMQIARILEAQKVIPSALGFKILLLVSDKGAVLKAGDYRIEAGVKPIEVLRQIVEGRVELLSLTIPEGYNLKQIHQVFKSQRFQVSDEEWRRLVSDPELISELGIPGPTLEGYLFPDTYLYSKSTSAAQLVREMVATFRKQTAAIKADAALQSVGLDAHQWVTLASIVEKETGAAVERPLIARVFLNRLAQGMLLQTDPTVIYGIANFNGNLTRDDLQRDTPYNTYTRAGLPPGPICSPGTAALKAVLEPASGDYIYFVSKGDGTHHFSITLEEHNQAVNYYQRRQGSPPPSP